MTAPVRSPQRLRRWRGLLVLTSLQALLALVIYARGFPYFGTGLVPNAAPWEVPVALVHLPAIELLTLAGRCCGTRNGTVLTHVIRGGHIPMTPRGTLLLAGSNWATWGLGLMAFAWWRSRRRSRPPPAAAPPGEALGSPT